MTSQFGLRSFSNLVTEIHAMATETDSEGLARWMVGELSEKIGFECAWYGWAQIDASGVQIHANATLNLPDDYFSFWMSMADEDLLAERLLECPWTIATYDRRSGRQTDGMTTLSDRYGLDKIATVMNHRKGRLASFYLSSYRIGKGARAFSASEQEYLQCAVEQLGHSMKLCALSGESVQANGTISILVNENGIGILGLGNLRDQLGDLWPEWKGDLLPERLRGLLSKPGHHVLHDQGVVVTCEKASDFKGMGLRRLTMRRMSVVDHLSPREKEIARLLAKGKSHKEVARLLGLAPSTVRNQTQSIYDKARIGSRAELASLIQSAGC
ncbi:MAG: LuxR C-terminal-related transcriptional regulator [Zhengella sp.]|uniref:response regulator transcription factor n=1 Tax=Zhengella sp. TaxID=2282762 RepID=UPI003528342A